MSKFTPRNFQMKHAKPQELNQIEKFKARQTQISASDVSRKLLKRAAKQLAAVRKRFNKRNDF